jgi:CBS domain-containing protein
MKTAGDLIHEVNRSLITVPRSAVVREALRQMAEHHVGAILITDDSERIVGIFTERDLLHHAAHAGFDPGTAVVGDYMIASLRSAPASDTSYQLMDKFLGLRLRHLLITDDDGAYIGMLSCRDVMKAALREKDAQYASLTELVNWDYYEEWRWLPATAAPAASGEAMHGRLPAAC